jgi:two-component system, chemotaxis family, CheB/CheR fusion protein
MPVRKKHTPQPHNASRELPADIRAAAEPDAAEDDAEPEAAPDSVSASDSNGDAAPSAVADADDQPGPGAAFPVIGMGASAGGLAALEAFFTAMPVGQEFGAAFVIVQHLDPNHSSILTDLVQRFTHLPVAEITDGTVLEPDHVYVIPPNREVGVLNGTLQLFEAVAPRGLRLPIDFFFRALGNDMHERAIGIVLAGTGRDGSLGVKVIESQGGIVIAQAPSSTQYDGMPRSAMASGAVDFIMLPAEMPGRIAALLARPRVRLDKVDPEADHEGGDTLKKILFFVRNQTGHDFSQYKEKSILRRIERRMVVNQIQDKSSYVRLLQQSASEIDALFRDFLIGVTSFFRDPEAFAALQSVALPRLFADRSEHAAIRVWVAACSTGEEVYSLAILLHEQIEQLQRSFKLHIFATDIDSRAIQYARAGHYPASVLQHVSPARLARYFTREGDDEGYRIKKFVRETILFSEQDVIRDPPFSNVDLISCRNLMIYMNAALQKRLLPTFHFSLRAGGLLFLGTSETVGESSLFRLLDRNAKIYETTVDGRRAHVAERTRQARLGTASAVGDPRLPTKAAAAETRPGLRELTEHALLEQYAPVGALVTDKGEILYLRGRTGRYLEPAPGEADMNVLKMAREGLRHELAHALRKAVSLREPVSRTGLRVKTNGGFSSVDLTVRPVVDTDSVNTAAGGSLFLIILQEPVQVPGTDAHAQQAGSADAPQADGAAPECDDGSDGLPLAARIAELKRELRARDEYYQSMTEELETSNEELKSANEEMQSINEELHSTNEELETSREELQSVNEELATVNVELQVKLSDLSHVTNDMNNLMAGTGIATIFVDDQLLIQRFTPAASQVIHLIGADVGRPLHHIVSKLVSYDGLADDIRSVLRDLVPKEIEVQNNEGRWFQLRIMPYRTLENVIQGVVATFVDVTELKQTQAALREANSLRRLAVVVRDAYDAITVMDVDGKILAWNPGAEHLYGWSEEEALQKHARDFMAAGRAAEELRRLRKLSEQETVHPYSTLRITKNGREVQVWVTATALVNAAGEVYAIATTEREQRGGDGIYASAREHSEASTS